MQMAPTWIPAPDLPWDHGLADLTAYPTSIQGTWQTNTFKKMLVPPTSAPPWFSHLRKHTSQLLRPQIWK